MAPWKHKDNMSLALEGKSSIHKVKLTSMAGCNTMWRHVCKLRPTAMNGVFFSMTASKSIDKAFKLFNEKKYKQAAKEFETITGKDDVDPWIKIKIKQYQVIANQQLSDRVGIDEPALKTVSYLMNLGEYDKAEKILEDLDTTEAVKAFLLAEIRIEQENEEEAVTYLKKAIDLDPCNVGYALNSPSFANVLNEEAFQFLRELSQGEEG